jgi:hypothetical protein
MIDLLDFRKDVYTNTGNDGIIRKILDIVKIDKGTFVEFGAWDGINLSNCRSLFEKGWSGLFIEADHAKCKKLKKNYKNHKNIVCAERKIGFSTDCLFDKIVDKKMPNSEIDFCSIDIDGLDLEIFETFERHMPKIVCIEGGQMLHPYHTRISKKKAEKNIQQSLSVMCSVFADRGYKIICTYQDSFFVKSDLYDLFDVETDLWTLYFSGLKAIYRRIPYIERCLSSVGIKNKIADRVLKKTQYKKYGWKKRKKWAEEMSDKIVKEIINVEQNMKH